MTLDQVETARRRAVTMFENFGDSDGAAEFDNMTADQYAESKGIEVINSNPQRKRSTGEMEGLNKKERGQLLTYIGVRVEDALEANSRVEMRSTLEEISDLTAADASLIFNQDGTVELEDHTDDEDDVAAADGDDDDDE